MMQTSTMPMLGQMLVDQGELSQDQLDAALEKQRESGARLGEVLVDLDFMSEEGLLQVLWRQMGVPSAQLKQGLVDPKVVRIIPEDKARLCQVMPMFKVHNELTVAMADPQSIFIIDDLESMTGCKILPVLCLGSDVERAIESYYRENVDMDTFLQSLEGTDSQVEVVEDAPDESEAFAKVEEMADDSPIVNLVNLAILNAIKDGASDIHIEPDRKTSRVRYRIDGVLHEVMTPRSDLHPAIASRVKVMGKMDIAERRLPQDGRIHVVAEGKEIDLRVSSMPTVLGEKIVMRVLDRSNVIIDLEQLGFQPESLAIFKDMLLRPHGVILVTGPTGSGKTTTLYSALDLVSSVERNVVTIEDPVEYQLDLINQVQVNEVIGYTFAEALRSILRQDPDVVLVGEIRDTETAHVAIQAALTGHLVLSTLHTNDSAGAITRLLNMGVEPYLLSSALVGVIAQRLVRKICDECRARYMPPMQLLDRVGWPEDDRNRPFVRGNGCRHCYGSGYKKRTGIHELLVMNDELRNLVLTRPSIVDLRNTRKRSGLRALNEEGLRLVQEGVSTVEEIVRVAFSEND